MLFKKILISVASLITIYTAFACDACSMYEYNTTQNKNYVGLFYRYRMFNGYNSLDQTAKFSGSQNYYKNARLAHIPVEDDDNTYNRSPYDYELFKTVELRFNYNYKDVINFLVIVPFEVNHMYFKEVVPPIGQAFDSLATSSGLGDIVLGISKIQEFEKGKTLQKLYLGVGLKLPTGRFDILNNENQLMDPDHQPGNGAFDFIGRINYNVQYNMKLGLRASANYAVSNQQEYIGSRSVTYRQGDRFNMRTDVYYPFGGLNLKFIPAIGAYYEIADFDKLNGNNWTITGGQALFLNFTPELKYKNIYFQPSFQLPISQNLNGEQLQNAGRLIMGLVYTF